MRVRLAVILAAAVGATSLVSAGPAQAAPTVANTNDSGSGSLRQAIAEAGPGETINLPAGTYTLTSAPLNLTKSVTIAGAGSSTTTLRSGGPFRVLEGLGPFDATIRDLTISNGNVTEPVARGAAIFAVEVNVTLQRVVVTGNVANANGGPGVTGGVVQGGILYAVGKTFNLLESRIDGNLVTANGGTGKEGGVVQAGVVLVVSSNTTIRDSSLSGNRVEAAGGQGPAAAAQNGGVVQAGVMLLSQNEPQGPMNIVSSTLANNVADADAGPGAEGGIVQGGVLLTSSGKAPVGLTNTTVAANVSRTRGTVNDGLIQGGTLLLSSGPGFPTTILDSTIGDNVSEFSNPSSLGGAVLVVGEARFGDTIVANGAGPAGGQNCAPAGPEAKLVSLGFNIDSLDQCGFKAAGDKVNTNPLLAPLQSNGGATQTMAPALASPAIDQGKSFGLTSDQRGIVRPIDLPSIPNSAAAGADGSDIGAVEFQPSNAFTLGKLTRNKKKGTARLSISLPSPSTGTLTLSGKGLKAQTAAITGETEVSLLVALASKKLRKALRKKGKRKVGINVTYAPTGNSAATQSRKAKLIKKKRKHKRKHPKPGKR